MGMSESSTGLKHWEEDYTALAFPHQVIEVRSGAYWCLMVIRKGLSLQHILEGLHKRFPNRNFKFRRVALGEWELKACDSSGYEDSRWIRHDGYILESISTDTRSRILELSGVLSELSADELKAALENLEPGLRESLRRSLLLAQEVQDSDGSFS